MSGTVQGERDVLLLLADVSGYTHFLRSGFEDFEVIWRAEVFADTPQANSAAAFGTRGANFRARKPME